MNRLVLAARCALQRVWCLLSTLAVRRRSSRDEGATVLLILGGSRLRELQCGKMVQDLPSTARKPSVVVLSSGAATAQELAAAAGVPLARVCLDGRAVDTVTNFTSIVHDLASMGCQEVAVATSSAHMRRASAVATVVLGSYGMRVQEWPCSSAVGEKYCHPSLPSTALFIYDYTVHFCFCSSDRHAGAESWTRAARDVARALLWVATRWDGSAVAGRVHPHRRRDASQRGARETLAAWLAAREF